MPIRPFVPADQDWARAIILEGLGEHFGFINAFLNESSPPSRTGTTRRGSTKLPASFPTIAMPSTSTCGCGCAPADRKDDLPTALILATFWPECDTRSFLRPRR